MDLEKAARESGLVRSEHIDDLLLSLKNRNYSWIICNPSQTEDRLQGDLLQKMPVALIDSTGSVRSRDFTAMVINNVCDLQPKRSEFITLAPVEDFERFATAALNRDRERAKTLLESIQANQIDEFLYLPNCSQLPNGAIVRLDLISSLSAVVYDTAISGGRRLASLTQNGFYFLLMKITHFLARPETSEIVRDK